MQQKDLVWTNRSPEDATKVYTILANIVNEYGMQLILEALLYHNDAAICAARSLDAEDDYLLNLKFDLEHALDNYMERYDDTE